MALLCHFFSILEFVGFCLLFGCGVRVFDFTRMLVFWVVVVGYVSVLNLCIANLVKIVFFFNFFVAAMCTVTVSSLFSITCCLREEQEFAFVA